MYKRLILMFSVAVMTVSCGNHFLSDSLYRKTVEADYTARTALFATPVADLSGLEMTRPEREAMQFLYAYMPLADVTDYSPEFYLENVRATFRALEEMPWGKDVPELLVRHFVLPLRANNENLDDARTVFYAQLKPRVEGLSAQEAILEVNHWCLGENRLWTLRRRIHLHRSGPPRHRHSGPAGVHTPLGAYR